MLLLQLEPIVITIPFPDVTMALYGLGILGIFLGARMIARILDLVGV